MKAILLVTISLGVLAACQSPQVRETDKVVTETTALELVADGRHGEAALEYVALSRNADGAVAQDLLLKAVALLLDIGRTGDASNLLDELSQQTLADDLAPRRNLLAADLALRRRDPDRTIELLSAIPAARFGPESTAKLHLLRARAYEDTGRFMDAAHARIALDAALSDDTRRATNHSALWEALIRTDRTRRERALTLATGTLVGWLRLAEVVDEHRSAPAALERALSRWQGEFPNHPANVEIVAAMLGAVRATVRRPTRIALLLPFHGDFAEAADRDPGWFPGRLVCGRGKRAAPGHRSPRHVVRGDRHRLRPRGRSGRGLRRGSASTRAGHVAGVRRHAPRHHAGTERD